MKRVLPLGLVALLMSISFNVLSQDPHFSQFYANPLYLNPAMAGTEMCPRLALNFRNQWPSLSGTYTTYSASYDQHVEALHGGIGFSIMNDRAGEGTLNTLVPSIYYSYRLEVNNKVSAKFGVQASYTQKSIDWDKLTFGDQIDEKYGFIYPTQEIRGEVKVNYLDFSAGALIYGDRYYFGFAANHLTQPDEGFLGISALPRKFTGHAGFIIPYNSRKRNKGNLSPNIVYQQQQDFNQVNYGFYVSQDWVVGGLWFRQNIGSFSNADAFIALIGVQQQHYKLGYSYDVTVSKLSNASGGSHEVSFGYKFSCRPTKKKFRVSVCPSF